MVQKLAGRITKGMPLFKGYPPYGSEASWSHYEGYALISKNTLRMVQKLAGRYTKGMPLFQRIPSVWFRSLLVAIRRVCPYIKEYPP